jgi:hypothetical protein
MAALFAILTAIQNLAVPASAVLGALVALATVIAHTPGVPAPIAAFCARVGVAGARFSVEKR